MLVNRRATSSIKVADTHLSLGWREALWEESILPKDTTQCPQPGLEPGPRDPESSAISINPARLHTLKETYVLVRIMMKMALILSRRVITVKNIIRYDYMYVILLVLKDEDKNFCL